MIWRSHEQDREQSYYWFNFKYVAATLFEIDFVVLGYQRDDSIHSLGVLRTFPVDASNLPNDEGDTWRDRWYPCPSSTEVSAVRTNHVTERRRQGVWYR